MYGINFSFTMKKSFFVGFLATLGFAEKYNYGSGETVNVQLRDYPSVTRGQAYNAVVGQGSAQNVINQVINNARASTVVQQRSIDSLFTQLPSTAQIDRLILNADTAALLRVVQTVATNDSLTCDQRMAYLLELLGRVRTAAESKQFSADQLKVIINGAQSQITRLQAEIDRLQGQINSLWIDQIRDELNKALADLQDLYTRFNAVQRQIAPKQAQIQGLKQQLGTVQRITDDQTQRIRLDRLKLVEAQANIRDLENRLARAREQRVNIENAIANSQRIISENDNQIAINREKIKELEAEIRRLTNSADALRAQYSDIEIEVERLRTEISIAQTKAEEYRNKIAELQARIDVERGNLANPELDEINAMIDSLKRAIPTVQSQIDRHYYFCYGGGVEETQARGVVVYVVQGERFGDYLQQQYGTNIRAPVNGQVNLQRVDILGKTWTDKFGYPYPDSSLGGETFDIAGSFNCLTPSRSVRGQGTITSINSDSIGVRMNDGSTFQFGLGTCSRIESTSSLPTIGMNIAYVAVPSSADGYNLYQATCY